VSDSRIPHWKHATVKAIAYHSHLYTRIAAGRETDDVERWLDTEFEAPAKEPLEKVVSDARLSPDDWRRLIRFAVAQDLRTPARLIENLQRWNRTLPELIDTTLRKSVERLEEAQRAGEVIPIRDREPDAYPMRITTNLEPDEEHGTVQAEIVVGRGLWLWSIQHILRNRIHLLQQQRWSVLRPPEGVTWVTSDDPVIRLNYYGNAKYDFQGGWANPGTKILFPVSPHHLLYTKIGHRRPPGEASFRWIKPE
jgi:hypothetical protein